MRHPAKYTDKLMPIFEEMLIGCTTVLDPFAGTGKIHQLPYTTVGIEIEKEWASMHSHTICADSRNIPFNDNTFDAICTSPTYGNRMADSHIAKDSSKRNTYTHTLGRQLSKYNTGRMQWGALYKDVHLAVYTECMRVLKDNGLFILNIKNHIRKGREADVASWHVKSLLELGMTIRDMRKIPVNGNRFGKNGNIRLDHEYIFKFEKLL